jgi:hypothetical protein
MENKGEGETGGGRGGQGLHDNKKLFEAGEEIKAIWRFVYPFVLSLFRHPALYTTIQTCFEAKPKVVQYITQSLDRSPEHI